LVIKNSGTILFEILARVEQCRQKIIMKVKKKQDFASIIVRSAGRVTKNKGVFFKICHV